MAGIDAYVKIMLHMNGANLGTSFPDDSGTSKSFTAAGDAKTSTTSPKFGSASLVCDGTGDYIYMSDHADLTLGNSDWTYECWIKKGVDNATLSLMGQCDSSGHDYSTSIYIQLNSANKVFVQLSNIGSITSTGTITGTDWHHLAIVRNGTTARAYIDGAQDGTASVSTTSFVDSSNQLSIGRAGEYTGSTWNGYIDEFRFSKGICRYPNGTTFTPQTEEFSLAGGQMTCSSKFWGA